ncbi:MAG: hypothetical protein GY761_20620 [Hyphomicrobiales bacterium]|nr:hypothetical protein [Hyphomicrobiales bacterium]
MVTDRRDTKRKNRAFWQSVIDEAVFNFADQPPPRHGGNNWIRIPMPYPANWISAFRDNKGNAGFFMSLDGEYGMSAYFEIEKASSQLENAGGLDIRMEIKCRSPFAGSISFDYDGDPSAEPMFREWLVKSSNRLVSTLRPFLEQLGIEKDRKKSLKDAQSFNDNNQQLVARNLKDRIYNGFSNKERYRLSIPQRAERYKKGNNPSVCCMTGFSRPDDIKGAGYMLAHLEDYRRPLDWLPMSNRAHNLLHRRFKTPQKWFRLVAKHYVHGAWFTFLTMNVQDMYRPYDEIYPHDLPKLGETWPDLADELGIERGSFE